MDVDCNVPITFNGHDNQSREDVDVRIVNIDAILDNDQNMDEDVDDLEVMHKYILPQTKRVKKWVLESIACAWRLFKCLLKANHYYKYDNDAERWKHRPSRIPDSHFTLLLQYWNTSTVKANRDGQAPCKRMMFEETRKRKDGHSYKKSYDVMLDKIIFWSSIPFTSKSSCYEGR
ncbi:hypothetical protein Cgig2_033503 [Carnegiea gigantea]|uniref:PiggyBac transposable element-derived protein domain-containing protein n=1 Tax=Carnegiea gigantea TaxID=171969 RepID=A0A9Q1Q962_9CARY|nr:hypothetical protein Cgig2_033503 [Carnegiea gigantea]